MREIKFRAWDGEKIRIVDRIDFNNKLFDIKLIVPTESAPQNWVLRKLSDTPLMQFTGLYDKNGKEIYEGDVVMWKYSTLQSDSFTHMVLWDAKWACFGMFDAGNQWCKESDWHRITDREVVGNIYENPELIKQ